MGGVSIRARITRAFRQTASSVPVSPARTDIAVCDGCGVRAEREPDGTAPPGWFRRLSGELLCRPCLAPVVEQASQFWDHDAVTKGDHE